ncbi:hypothetical protein AKJ16_DCAP24343 [Drosera capensis]
MEKQDSHTWNRLSDPNPTEDEGDDVDDKGDGGDEGKRKRDSSEDVDQPPQKKSKQDEGASSSMPVTRVVS